MIKKNDYEREGTSYQIVVFVQAELKLKEGQQGSCPGLDFLFFSVAHRSPHLPPAPSSPGPRPSVAARAAAAAAAAAAVSASTLRNLT